MGKRLGRLVQLGTGAVRRMPRRGSALGAAAVALAVGGIVLMRAPGKAEPNALAPEPAPVVVATPAPLANGGTRMAIEGPALRGTAAVAQSAVEAGGTRRLFAHVKLRAATDAARAQARTPVALAIVLDVSGSMYAAGKLEQARSSVAELVRGMDADDWVTVIAYDSTARVVQPLVRVGPMRNEVLGRIRAIEGGGGT